MLTLKLRVYDELAKRYGTIDHFAFLKDKVIYSVYDKNGDPVEVVPTTIGVADCVIECEINGVWTPVKLWAE